MNPFDLKGPAFLALYAAIGAGVVLGTRWLRTQRESGPVPRLTGMDPYLIACLRGGPSESIRVAILSMLGRGQLERVGADMIKATAGADRDTNRLPPHRLVEPNGPQHLRGLHLAAGTGRARRNGKAGQIHRHHLRLALPSGRDQAQRVRQARSAFPDRNSLRRGGRQCRF